MKNILIHLFGALLLVGLIGFQADARIKGFDLRFAPIIDDGPSKAESTGVYELDKAHSYVGFRIMHLGLTEVPGSFNDFTGRIDFDANKIENSKVSFVALTKSVDTRNEGRDKHLRSKDFFEVDKYPEMSFKSTRVKKKGKKYVVYGDLTMKGITKPVEIEFKIHGPIRAQRGSIKIGVQGSTVINRRDFGVNYGSNLPSGVPMLSDNVIIDIQLEAGKQSLKQPR